MSSTLGGWTYREDSATQHYGGGGGGMMGGAGGAGGGGGGGGAGGEKGEAVYALTGRAGTMMYMAPEGESLGYLGGWVGGGLQAPRHKVVALRCVRAGGGFRVGWAGVGGFWVVGAANNFPIRHTRTHALCTVSAAGCARSPSTGLPHLSQHSNTHTHTHKHTHTHTMFSLCS